MGLVEEKIKILKISTFGLDMIWAIKKRLAWKKDMQYNTLCISVLQCWCQKDTEMDINFLAWVDMLQIMCHLSERLFHIFYS